VSNMCDLNGAVGLGSRLMGQPGREYQLLASSYFILHLVLIKLQKPALYQQASE
jgi:hypothetical protein